MEQPEREGAAYSPDGEWIAYKVGPTLFKRPLSGPGPGSSEARMNLIQNFFTELEERAGS